MLQQTQVATVINYYTRWMQVMPGEGEESWVRPHDSLYFGVGVEAYAIVLTLFVCLGAVEVANTTGPGQCFPGGESHPWVGEIEATEGLITVHFYFFFF
jgi:hypothetical protein